MSPRMSGLLARQIDEETRFCGLKSRVLSLRVVFAERTKQGGEKGAVSPANLFRRVDTPTSSYALDLRKLVSL